MKDVSTTVTALDRLAGVAQWLAGVVAATFAVMLFTLGAGNHAQNDSSNISAAAADDTAARADTDIASNPDADAQTSARAPAEAFGAEVLNRGEALYVDHCAVCHGHRGLGVTAVALAGRMKGAYPRIADQIAVVADGRDEMPGFSDRLTPAELEAVVAFTRHPL